MSEREKPRERLVREYNEYVDKMLQGDCRLYNFRLYNLNNELVINSNVLAFNRNHAMIEISNSYKIEELRINRIELGESEE